MTLIAYAAEQQQPQIKDLPKSKTTQNTAQDYRGTPETPLVIKVIPTIEDKEKAKADEAKEAKKFNLDFGMLLVNRHLRNITIGLGIIAFLQLIAGVFQTIWVGKTLKATEKAAKAAETSANAYMVAERAWISYLGVEPSNFFEGTGLYKDGVMFVIKWTNGGRTPALRCSTASDGKSTYDGTIPEFSIAPKSGDGGVTAVPGMRDINTGPASFSTQEINDLVAGKCRIFLYGRIDYDTLFSKNTRSSSDVCMEVMFFARNEKGGIVYRYMPRRSNAT